VALPRPSRPSVVYADLRDFMRQRPRHQWLAGTLAVMIPTAILGAFVVDASMSARPRPDIHYVTSWPADRSDDEIKASQQAAVERRQAIRDERQRQFRRLQKQAEGLGITRAQPDDPAPPPAAPQAGGEARR
jgi:hypothetical protein